MLDLMPHLSDIVSHLFERIVLSVFWQGLGDAARSIFIDEKDEPVAHFAADILQELSVCDRMGMNNGSNQGQQ